jgi:uncharacterized protein YodC (DUF2158 family)
MSWVDAEGHCSNCYALLDGSQSNDTTVKGTTKMTIQLGDVVWLKSGGPAMTVSRVGPEGKPDSISCIWFPTDMNGQYAAQPEVSLFNMHSLRLTEDDMEPGNEDDSLMEQNVDAARPRTMSPGDLQTYIDKIKTAYLD